MGKIPLASLYTLFELHYFPIILFVEGPLYLKYHIILSLLVCDHCFIVYDHDICNWPVVLCNGFYLGLSYIFLIIRLGLCIPQNLVVPH